MAHEIYNNDMAYVGRTPWHGLGAQLPEDATIEQWREAAGFDWEIEHAPVIYDAAGQTREVPNRVVLFRSDTGAPLSVMSTGYRPHQPAQVMDFFAEICESQHWGMETAGMLKGGAQYWALAKAGLDAWVGGREDRHLLYMLLATSADGSLATVAQATDVRVVCANTLAASMKSEKGKTVKIRHDTAFDAGRIKRDLGMVDFEASWDAHVETLRALQGVKVDEAEARLFFSELLRPTDARAKARQEMQASDFDTLLNAPVGAGYTPTRIEPERAVRGLDTLLTSYHSAPGAAPGTAYGLLQGVTHYLDHVRGPDQGKRLSSAWFGQGAALKQRAVENAMALTGEMV